MIEIPVDCLAYTRLKSLRWLPIQFMDGLTGVDSISPVMPRPVLDETNQSLVRFCCWSTIVQRATNQSHNVDIRPLIEATNIVRFARPTAANRRIDGSAMIDDVEPVANIAAVAVNRDLLLINA